MALNGRIEDMNLLEILQIVAFSKRTGTLEIQSPRANGSFLFRDGRLLCAFSSATEQAVRSLVEGPLDPARESRLAQQIRIAVREVIALREGHFEFGLLTSLPAHWRGMDVSSFLAGEGVETQELLLELARELDEARKDSSRLLEAPDSVQDPDLGFDGPQLDGSAVDGAVEPPLSEAGVTVLLVDDEPLVLQVVAQELDDAGAVVETAGGTEEALASLKRLKRSGAPILLVVDAGMPASSRDAFDGGLEILESSRTLDIAAPAILMAENLSQEDRDRARRLGVHKIALKPTLTKLDPEEYGSDLHAFGRTISRELLDLARGARGTARPRVDEPSLNHGVIFDFLKSMTDQLLEPANGITKMILRVAAKYTERAALFLVKDGRASGLAGVQHGRPTTDFAENVRRIGFELQEVLRRGGVLTPSGAPAR